MDSPIGKICIEENGEAVTHLFVVRQPSQLELSAEDSQLLHRARMQLTEYFAGARKEFDIPLQPAGTDFQKKVWAALREIPYGQTRCYEEIAQAVGNPKACRAVGGANNKNPILIMIPCHRVVGMDGKMVGFAAGLDRKKSLLDLETQGKVRMD